MPEIHEDYHLIDRKRQILIVDDEEINRDLLGFCLEKDYELLYAADGLEALDQVALHVDTLSLILLDLMMPKMDGLEVLRRLKAEGSVYQHIPVIVLTADQDAEIECLHIGAIDFIPKPYPTAAVILARVRRTILFWEDKQTIADTQYDALTGLNTKEYFYRYVSRHDQFHKEMDMDAVVLDINHFHMVNERYGKARGDRILKTVAAGLMETVRDNGGFACRKGADTFLLYCPGGLDYAALLGRITAGVNKNETAGESVARIRLRAGVYANVDKSIDIDRRFDRAKSAADTIRNNFTRQFAVYDSKLHEAELYAEQLVDDFPQALARREFTVFYQPKFHIQGEAPVLSSAEALVRWIRPESGMISPGVFIPLFEKNGLIRQLDQYVWREAASQVRKWRDSFGVTVPVSVNVSRIDMFDTDLVEIFTGLLEEFELQPEDLLIEITESAYTDDSAYIIATVNRLREKGFQIEMDDFGTGYSSLGMLSHLPIDALKLDMLFVRNAFGEKKDLRMLELIMGIAGHLEVPVIAEGVETKEQMEALKEMGCQIVQGYYFSKPVPAGEFERFITQGAADPGEGAGKGMQGTGRDSAGAAAEPAAAKQEAVSDRDAAAVQEQADYAVVSAALAADYICTYYVDIRSGRFTMFGADKELVRELGLPVEGQDFFEESGKTVGTSVYETDRAEAQELWDRKKLDARLEDARPYVVSYRILEHGRPVYICFKIVRMKEDDRKIVIGVGNIDAQKRREIEQDKALAEARALTGRDELTGVKSRSAFHEAAEEWNRLLKQKKAPAFAVAAFDINDLQRINESYGYKTGDRYIREASSVICSTFKRSPVFRTGGDEFAVILSGKDYEDRERLSSYIHELNIIHRSEGGVIAACGVADMIPGTDTSLEDVCLRAEAAMKENKARLKQA